MKKIFLIIFTGVLILGFNSCDNNKKKDRKPTGTTELKQKEYSFENPPEFRKDGELVFLEMGTNKELFKIETEIASTDEERARGLMFRNEMAENQGMLFLFAQEEIQSFYMRNTIISLDIIYVNSKMEIVDIYPNTEALSETSLPSKAPAMYVVEINAGLCKQYGIEVGDLIRY
jgi:uncharacterized membrane protein (UPF0127 family)